MNLRKQISTYCDGDMHFRKTEGRSLTPGLKQPQDLPRVEVENSHHAPSSQILMKRSGRRPRGPNESMAPRQRAQRDAELSPTRTTDREPLNAKLVARFSRGELTARDVLKATTGCIKNLGGDWKAAVACVHALQTSPRLPLNARQKENVQPDKIIYSAAISACAKAAQAGQALKLFDELLQRGPYFPVPVYPDTITYNAALSACEKAGEDQEAMNLFEHLLNDGPHFPDPVYPDTITYNTAISACARAGRADKALELFNHLCKEGPKFQAYPDITIYSTTIFACVKAGWDDKALGLFEHLRKHGPHFPGQPVHPDAFTYNVSISACKNAGRADKALELFDELLGKWPTLCPNTITYNNAISACEKAGEAEEALRLFKHLLEAGPRLQIYPDIITYSAAISACEKADRADLYPKWLSLGIHGHPGKPETRVFQPSLGFDEGRNMLNLHGSRVLVQQNHPMDRDSGVHPAVARAIFLSLLKPEEIGQRHPTGINEKTLFVVGQHGEDMVKEAIARCMREQGWNPVHPPTDHSDRPNRGCLVAALPPAMSACA